MSPMLKKVEKAGVRGLKMKRKPYNIMPEDFYKDVSELKRLFSLLINAKDSERIALSPSVSYGIANVTNNIFLKSTDNIVITEGQFPSNVYPWVSLAKKYNSKLVFAKKPKINSNQGELWNKNILDAINKNTRVVSIGLHHWAEGTKFDIESIREKTKSVGSLLIIDGTQSIGVVPFDVSLIKPDALVCAGYKWLMGPYGITLSYYGEFFDKGFPIEESWVNRKNSVDFSGLINYQDKYEGVSNRYSVGQQSNFINISMMSAAINQINNWGVENIYNYINSITNDFFNLVNRSNFWVEKKEYRSAHLFGIKPKKNNQNILKNLKEKNIYVSLRGDSIRVSPSVYNKKEDLMRLLSCLNESV